jgi:hypothetical protein
VARGACAQPLAPARLVTRAPPRAAQMETYQRDTREMKVEFITKDKGYKPKARRRACCVALRCVAGPATAARGRGC